MSESHLTDQDVTIDYTNHRGLRSKRRVRPKKFFFGSSPFHDHVQWFLEAFDLEKDAVRTFALKDIHEWKSEARPS
jgi:predicted DNA-binding transcriptional regulator YafY